MRLREQLTKRDLFKYGILGFFLLIMAISAQYSFLSSVYAGKTAQLGADLYLIIGFAGLSLLLLSLAAMFSGKKTQAASSEARKNQMIISYAGYAAGALITGLIYFILCRIDVGIMASSPDQIVQVKGVTAYLLQFYMGIRIDITVGTSLGLYTLLMLSGLFLICIHSLAGFRLSELAAGKLVWILSMTGVLLISCFLIRLIWGLPVPLAAKLILLLTLSAAVFLADCLKNQVLKTKRSNIA